VTFHICGGRHICIISLIVLLFGTETTSVLLLKVSARMGRRLMRRVHCSRLLCPSARHLFTTIWLRLHSRLGRTVLRYRLLFITVISHSTLLAYLYLTAAFVAYSLPIACYNKQWLNDCNCFCSFSYVLKKITLLNASPNIIIFALKLNPPACGAIGLRTNSSVFGLLYFSSA